VTAPDQRTRRALLVEDDPDAMGLLRQICRDAGLVAEEALDAETALALARERPPDLVLTDLVLPGMDGVELTRQIRNDARFTGAPVIVLSARRTQDAKVAAFEAGAIDYIEKPFHLRELDARIRAALHQRELFLKLERANWELRLANERLEEQAGTDDLTGLCNARQLRERLTEEFLRAERYQTPLAVVLADLDGFKEVNDTHGHAAGDRVLAQLAQRLRAQARATDIVGRLGGDEFTFLLPHTGLADAMALARRLCERLGAAPARLADGKVARIAVSCGVAAFLEQPGIASPAELLAAADAALYEAKHQGGSAAVAAGGAGAEARASTPVALEQERDTEMPRPRFPRGAGAA